MKLNKKRSISLLTALVLVISMLTVMVFPATAIETEADPYALVTGTVNEDGTITPDSNVTFFFAKQPADASANGFAYTYPGNNKTYYLHWDKNAKTMTANAVVSAITTPGNKWATDTTDSQPRDVVLVFAPGTYSHMNLNNTSDLKTKATDSDPKPEEMVNIHFLGAKAGVSPVSTDRSSKDAALQVKNRTNDAINESIIGGLWRFPRNANIIYDGFTTTGTGSLFTINASGVFSDVIVKNHYTTDLTTAYYNSSIVYMNNANQVTKLQYEDSYFDMELTAVTSTKYDGFVTNKLLFDNCVFINANNTYTSQKIACSPFYLSKANEYKDFLGEYATSPKYQITNSVFADWADTRVFQLALGLRSVDYAKGSIRFNFNGNKVFDCGKVDAASHIISITGADSQAKVVDVKMNVIDNLFSFSDVFAKGETDATYAISIGTFGLDGVSGSEMVVKNNTVTIPAGSEDVNGFISGTAYACQDWDVSDNVYQTDDGESLEIKYPFEHTLGELIIDKQPTATESGEGHFVCTKCGEEVFCAIDPGEAQIDDTIYTTLQDALSAAKAGDAVMLRSDVQQSAVIVCPDVTLDLNGCSLTADYVVGLKTSAIIDSSVDNTAKLIVDKKAAAMDQSNQGFIPVYDTNGYIFTTIGLTGRGKFTAADKYVFSPVFESFVHDALYAGKQNSGIEVIVRLKWKREGNYDGIQEFIYLDDKVQSVIDSYIAELSDYELAFKAEFCGKEAESDPNMEVNAVIRSAAGVEIDTSSTVFDEDNIVFSFGALSDTHVRHPDASVAEAEKFSQALELLKEQALINDSDGLDAITIAGDLTDMGRTNQADVLVDIVKDSGIDTAMLSLGNHDMYTIGSTTYDPALLPYYAETLGDIFTKNAVDMSMMDKDAYHCVVDGNHFIMLRPNPEDLKGNQNYFPFEQDVLDWLDATLKKITAADPTSYVFLVTHVPAYQTVYKTHLNWNNYVTKNLSSVIDKYPQVVMFSGHLHSTLVEERSIMQTKFTSVVSGATNSTGQRWDGTEEVENIKSKRGSILLVQIDGNGNLRLTRMFIHDGSMIKEPWEVSHPTADNAHLVKYSKATREAANVGPTLSGQLNAVATTTATETGFTATVDLSFAAGEDDDFVHHYQITATNLTTGEAKVFNRGSDFAAFSDSSMMLNEVAYSISLTCTEAAEYSIEVVAIDSWDVISDKISCNITVEPPQA